MSRSRTAGHVHGTPPHNGKQGLSLLNAHTSKPMKRTLLILLLLAGIAVSSVMAAAEITRKTTGTYVNGKPFEYTYYDPSGREIAKHVIDEDGSILRASGRIPDGVVREYYPRNTLFLSMREFTDMINRFLTDWVKDVDADTNRIRALLKKNIRRQLAAYAKDADATGGVKSETPFLGGKPHGMAVEYDSNGRWIKKTRFEKGSIKYSEVRPH